MPASWQPVRQEVSRVSDQARCLPSRLLSQTAPSMETSIEIVVRPTEIDVNGHVNNAKYVEYLEWGREDWYDQVGLSHDRLLGLGAITVTVNLNLNYRRECRQGERLRISTRPERLGRSSFAVRQEIHTSKGEIAADAVVTIVTIDAVTRKSRPVPDELSAGCQPRSDNVPSG